MISPFGRLQSPNREFVENLSAIAKEKNALFVPSPDGTNAIFQLQKGPVLQLRIEGAIEDRLLHDELHPVKLLTVTPKECFDQSALKAILGLLPNA